jgi:glycerophosphoryl diester phosphodiesterase
MTGCAGKSQSLEGDHKPLNIGHAGMGFSSLVNPFNPLPENSMASLQKAMELGADGVEVDVQLTADSVLVLYHDKRLDSKTATKGCISELKSTEVIGVPYKMGFPFDWFHNESIISLEQLFEEFSRRDSFPWVYLDIHSHNYCDLMKGYASIGILARSLARLIEKHNIPEHKIKPTSTYYKMLLEVRKANPRLTLLLEEDTDFDKGMRVLEKYSFDGLVLKRKRYPGVAKIKAARNAGVEIVFFGGKSRSSISKMIDYNVDALQVNNVKALNSLLNEGND